MFTNFQNNWNLIYCQNNKSRAQYIYTLLYSLTTIDVDIVGMKSEIGVPIARYEKALKNHPFTCYAQDKSRNLWKRFQHSNPEI